MRSLRLAALLGCATLTFHTNVASADPPDIVRIEEDWRIEIGTPDPTGSAPQIVVAMSSTAQLADVHALFEVNHNSLPSYNDGGIQLQVWSGGVNLDYRNAPKVGALGTQDEVITFTTRMELAGGVIQFEVDDGNSTTWNTFGGQGYLKSNITTSQTSLSQYSTATSVANSYVGFAKHRVKRFVLTEVRYYSHSGLVTTDTTDRVVHELDTGSDDDD